MISGYNTDVSHKERVFHVQTEDKGMTNPFIESLVYVGGQVVGSRRTGYAELLAEGKGVDSVMQIMEQQHRSMMQSVREGQFDNRLAELFGGKSTAKVKSSPRASGDRTLDEVILDYLNKESQKERLLLQLEEDVELCFGQPTEMSVRTSLSRSGMPAPGTEVTCRMISTLHEPSVIARGRTDDSGMLRFRVEIPEQAKGNSALIISASSDAGKAELKYLL
jgi:hypothetical protein